MAVSLTDSALCTLADLKTELGISGSGEDDTLKRMINAASAQIAGFCNRSFYYETGKVEYVAGYGTPYLRVSKYPLEAITSIVYLSSFSGTTGSTISSNDYVIRERDKQSGRIFREDGWLWTAAMLGGATYPAFPGTESPLYKVTYSGGYVTQQQDDDDNPSASVTRDLPYDLEDACIQLAAQRYLSSGDDRRINAEKLMSYSVTYSVTAQSSTDIPASIKCVLNRYRRVPQSGR